MANRSILFNTWTIATMALWLCWPVHACPSNPQLLQLCQCDSTINGVVLQCSGSDLATTLALLRASRAQLGLIQELVFQNSSINAIPPNSFQGLFVKKLDLGNNLIQRLDPDAFQGLQNVLQTLNIQGNRLTEVPAVSLSGMTNLLQIDMSRNQVGDLGPEILQNVPKMFDLNLAQNRICAIHKDAFQHMKHSLQTLNLGGNCLPEVPASAVRGFQQLLALHLHDNQIRELGALQFMNLPSLNLVNLAGNQIQAIHQQTFLNVPNLKFIYLTDNAMTRLEPGQFQPFQNLELLDLSRNQLQKIPAGAFSNLPRLTQVYLSGNRITEVEANAFANSSLVILLLSENKLFHVSSDMFAGLGLLQQLSLKNNEIALIAQNAFYQVPSLVVLDMSHNKIANLEPSTFLAQLSLFLLDLSHNQLITVPYSAFNQRIATVILQENPLVCSERVHLLQNGVGIFVPGTKDAICGDTPSNGPAPGVSVSNQTNLIPSGPLIPEIPNPGIRTDSPSFVQAKPTQPQPFQHQNGQGEFTEHPPVIITFTTAVPKLGQVPLSGGGGSLPGGRLTPTGNLGSDPQTSIYYPNSPYLIEVPSTLSTQPKFTSPINNPQAQYPQPAFPSNPSQAAIATNPAAPNGSFTLSFPSDGNVRIGSIGPSLNGQTPIQVGNTVQQTGGNGSSRTWPGFSSEAQLPSDGNIFSGNSNSGIPNGPVKPFAVAPEAIQPGPTLPPGVILATDSHPRANGGLTHNIELFSNIPPKKPTGSSPWGPDARGPVNGSIPGTHKADTTASTIIAVALTVVILVLLVVFVTLCIVRHRTRRNGSAGASSDESRTSAYVAAQAARLNYNVGTHMRNGTFSPGHAPPIPHARVTSPTHQSASTTYSNSGGAWLYTPAGGASYTSYYGTSK